jgi:multidrug efflux pump subunit AcrB
MSASNQQPHYLIATFTRHRLASNLLMIMMLLAGLWGIRQLSVQLNPTQASRSIAVTVVWPGAAAEDVEQLVTQALEYQLRSLTNLETITSSTSDSTASISLRFEKGTDMSAALDRAKQRVAQARDLPADIEPPVIERQQYYETVAAILLSGTQSIEELVPLARTIERDLMSSGADMIEFLGVPSEEIAIQIDSKTLFALGVPLSEIAARVLNNSADIPAGSAGDGQLERKLRSLDQRRSSREFADMPISSTDDAQLLRLSDIATIERRQRDQQRLISYNNEPAVMIRLRRAPGSDTVDQADVLYQWYADNAAALEQRGVKVTIWLEAWKFATDTLNLVLKNGLGGLFLVIATLFVFLNGRAALWVSLGIPVSFLGALAVFHFMGGTINFVSTVGMVMALGIVVDDAIVVGEHSLAQFDSGKSPVDAAALGAQRMFTPVVASSLTTMAAFLPLIIIDEATIREIPLLMLCVILASLIECFLIMPGHFRHSFERMKLKRPGKFRQRFDASFERFRADYFLPVLDSALNNRRATVALALCAFAVALTLLASGRVKPELNLNLSFEFANAHIQFAAGSSDAQKIAFMDELERALAATDEEFGGDVVITHAANFNWANLEQQEKSGSQYAAIWAELVSVDKREVTLSQFSAAWKDKVRRPHFVETMSFAAREDSQPDLQLYFSGDNISALKSASMELQTRLASYPGVSKVFDDLPYGKEQYVFKLTTQGRSAGLSSASIGRQLRAAFEGFRVQLFTENDAELEVRVSLPQAERDSLATIGQLPITTPSGEVLPLLAVATIESRRGIDRINHRDARKAINVFGHVDTDINTAMNVISELEDLVIPDIVDKYAVKYGLGEQSAEEAKVLTDLLMSAGMAMVLIYLILAWIFSSWSWPLAVMVAIPLGFTGALAGLYLLGLNLGVMAIMGLFTLTGVIVNDSIILINTYKEHHSNGMSANEALRRACSERLRAVILTSLTTTLGMAPMMLESSPMGSAMAPLAVVICFGLLYGTTLILFVIPALLSALDTISQGREFRQSHEARTDQNTALPHNTAEVYHEKPA